MTDSGTTPHPNGDAELNNWSPTSWRSKKVLQDVAYDNPAQLQQVLQKLDRLPPLVSHQEVSRQTTVVEIAHDLIKKLRQQLAEVAENKRFLLQGGDCAELFDYCSQEPIENKLKVLLQMSLILVWGGRTSVTRIARMAGQYAKPRSKATEVIDGVEYNAFRGDNVNGIDLAERKPDPQRLLGAYFHSAATINYVRALLAGDFADLHHPESWNLKSWDFGHVENPTVRAEYQAIVRRLNDALDFMRTIGADSEDSSRDAIRTVDMFTSHEGLLLEYEQQLTRKVDGDWYNLGAHYLWIGDRTRQLDGGHVEYFRGIVNPIGVKVGPSMKPEELAPLLDILDPNFEPGKVTLITRYGHDKIFSYLPAHIQAVRATKHKVVWCCDPMHGNTETTATGVKTRRFNHIAEELSKAFRIHKECESKLGGVHFELTGDPVTETIGGSMNLQEADLSRNYQTFCDPRLNYEQSLDIAFMIANYYEGERSSLRSL
ncbi:3-deoxy-7-phosphoheptulonate synthase [Spizellomyces sp. 'palustris']|nr:3-deoxy-7-phosphoheptulonate synthase [Spizellomyces sp. 'palustris']